MAKTLQEINKKIKEGKAVVLTAEEMVQFVKENGTKAAAEKVDAVTTATFGPMCSSSIYMNLGHSRPRIKLGGGRAALNGVPAYCGFAAVDILLGACALPDDDPRNHNHPGEFKYGGAHVIEELVAGKEVLLEGEGYGTDCYPRRKIETKITLKDLNEAVLFNPRNCYQNYNVAVNLSAKTIYTYLGILKPNMGNAVYCSAGQLSPLLKDPFYRTIGIGTRIFLGGGTGYVAFWGTQHHPGAARAENGVPLAPSGTLALIGDLKGMSSKWLKGLSMHGYGVTLMVGIGIPIPILDEDLARTAGLPDSELFAPVVDYSDAYPNRKPDVITRVNYADLKSGEIEINGRKVPTGSLSSYSKAREIAGILKEEILKRRFVLTEKAADLPGTGSGIKPKPLEIK